MELEWENGTGKKQCWSSWSDPLCGWFEAEKILPSSVTDIRVHFKIHTVVKSFPVCAVIRPDNCNWVWKGTSKDYEYVTETFSFCQESRDECPAVDVTFELTGTVADCHVWRVWNAARDGGHQERWEWWEDSLSRPRMEPGPDVLQAADAAAPPGYGSGDPEEYCAGATRRLIAAAKTLQEIRRSTLVCLRDIDQQQTDQWVAVNSTNSLSAGLAIASAVTLFIAPPIGIGLGIGSAGVGVSATVGEAVADHATLNDLRGQMSKDILNTFAVTELQREWLQARDCVGTVLNAPAKGLRDDLGLSEVALESAQAAQMGVAIANTMMNFADDAAQGAAAVGETAAVGARVAPVAMKVFGVAGAVFSTGIAVHGWSTTKSLQGTVRAKLKELTSAMLCTQRWLSAMSQLECPICLLGIELSDEAQCCLESWHYSHKRCLQMWVTECQMTGREASCPQCCGALAQRAGVLEELITEDVASLLRDTSA